MDPQQAANAPMSFAKPSLAASDQAANVGQSAADPAKSLPASQTNELKVAQLNGAVDQHALGQGQLQSMQQQQQQPLKLVSAQSLIQNHLTGHPAGVPPLQTQQTQPQQPLHQSMNAPIANGSINGFVLAPQNGVEAHANAAAFSDLQYTNNNQGTGQNNATNGASNSATSEVLARNEAEYDIYTGLPKPTPNTDPDNCFKCKNPGDFINCSSCEKPYHLFCADLERMPERVWECFECQHISRERLIRNLKEKQRQKVREREFKKEKDRLERESAKQQREKEQQQRREQKEQRKNALKIAKLHQQEQRRQAMAEQAEKAAELRAQQMVMGPDGKPVLAASLRQTTLKTEKRKRVKAEHVLTLAEREKIERTRLIKQQFQIFQQAYPEYVERNSVRYPIPDGLIEKMPELHGGMLKAKPQSMKINIEAEAFERLLYIWEFCNNFNEFLDTPSFKIEELAACLTYRKESDERFQMSTDEVYDLDWTEQMQIRHIEEKGFHMVNHLLTAIAQCYLHDLFPADQVGGQAVQAAISSGGEKQNQILASIDKLIQDKQKLWPEIIRMILAYARSEDPDIFGPFNQEVSQIEKKLVGMKPANFTTGFSYHEKVTLFTVLIDCIHETNEFRLFLNKRVEDKSTYNKEKMEVYQQIRDLETRQQEFVKTHAEQESSMTQEQMQEKLEELDKRLLDASRIEAKPIKEEIAALERKKNNYTNQLAHFDDQIKKKQIQISRLNEKTYKASIKTTMLGKDASKSEYWHFKDDNTRIYIRKETAVPLAPASVDMADEQQEQEGNAGERNGDTSEVALQIQKESTQVDSANRVALEQSNQILINTCGDQFLQQQDQFEALPQQQSLGEQMVAFVAAPAEIFYSWHYYEREDQIEELLESLNIKGQHERKLQENLRKVKDRLKLKKAKKVPAPATPKLPTIEEQSATAAQEKPTEQTVEGLQTEDAIAAENPGSNMNAAEGGPIAAKAQSDGEALAKEEDAPREEGNYVAEQATGEPKQVEMTNEESKTVLEEPSRDQGKSVDISKADQTVTVQQDDEELEMDEEQVDETRRVMFETDVWEDCITESVWFGHMIPQKRRMGARGAAAKQDQVKEFFDDVVNFEACKSHLISISDSYMKASVEHDREWEEEQLRKDWAENVHKASSIRDMIPLIEQLDAGMCLPISLSSRQGPNGEPGKVQRMKLQLFKFWPSQDIKQAWKFYMEQEGSLGNDNLNSLYISLLILETACEQFSVRQAQKMERKNRQAIMQAVQPTVQQVQSSSRASKAQAAVDDWTGRGQRAANRQVIKYYESSQSEDEYGNENEAEGEEAQQKEQVEKSAQKEDESMEEESEDAQAEQSEQESSQEEQPPARKVPPRGRTAKAAAMPAKKAKKTAAPEKKKGVQPRRGRGEATCTLEDSDEEQASNKDQSSEEGEPNQQSEESDEDSGAANSQGKASEPIEEDIEWDEYCYECQDGGNVMCCESCPQVAHYQCVGLRQAPRGDWWCKDCSAKKAQDQQQQKKALTRGASGAGQNGKAASGSAAAGKTSTRQATLTSMIPKRSSRRAGK